MAVDGSVGEGEVRDPPLLLLQIIFFALMQNNCLPVVTVVVVLVGTRILIWLICGFVLRLRGHDGGSDLRVEMLILTLGLINCVDLTIFS